jgi:hypothetical protein
MPKRHDWKSSSWCHPSMVNISCLTPFTTIGKDMRSHKICNICNLLIVLLLWMGIAFVPLLMWPSISPIVLMIWAIMALVVSGYIVQRILARYVNGFFFAERENKKRGN